MQSVWVKAPVVGGLGLAGDAIGGRLFRGMRVILRIKRHCWQESAWGAWLALRAYV